MNNALKSSLVAQICESYRISVCGVTEVWMPGSGTVSITPPESRTRFSFHWSGHATDKKEGVGFLLSPEANDALVECVPVSSRLIRARFITPSARITAFCCYAPTCVQPTKVHDAFYDNLAQEISAVPRHDLLLVLGDFNAHTGAVRSHYEPILGPFANPAARDPAGSRLLDLCSQNNLFISNTFFRHKPVHRDTYQAKRGNASFMLDLVLADRRHRSSILDTRVKRHARGIIETDHELVVTTVRLKFRAPARLRRAVRQPDSSALIHSKRHRSNFQTALNSHLENQAPGEEPEEIWQNFAEACSAASSSTLPPRTRQKHKHWMTPEIQDLIHEKAAAFTAWRTAKRQNRSDSARLESSYRTLRNRCKHACEKARRADWNEAARTLKTLMQKNRPREIYDHLRQYRIRGPRPGTDLKSKSGELLTSTHDKLDRWAEFFAELLTSDFEVEEKELESIPVADAIENEPPPTLDEIEQTIRSLKNRKAAGPDAITTEMLKYGGEAVSAHLHQLIERVWHTERCPQAWKDAAIVTLYKKGDSTDCGNYRGISLLSIPGKVYALTLLNRLRVEMDALVMEEQAGFRAGRSTMDGISTLTNILNNAFEFDVPTHACFIDLRKAYDTVNRPAMWRILQKTNLSKKTQRLLQDLHTGTRACVKAYGEQSDFFEVNRGVRQGCVLAPALFNIFLDHVVRVALDGCHHGVHLRYTVNNEIRIRPIRQGERDALVQILLYADDMVLMCDTTQGLVEMVTRLDAVTQQWGLDISQPKTKILSIDRNDSVPPFSISLRGEEIEHVDEFVYLGRLNGQHPSLSAEITRRLNAAKKAFRANGPQLYYRKDLRAEDKVKIYKTTVLPCLLYGAGAWNPTQTDLRRLESFQSWCMRVMLGIYYATHGHIRNSVLRQRCRLTRIENLIRTRRLRWFGHIARMEEGRLPRRVFFSRPPNTRKQGRPFKNWRQCVLEDLRDLRMERDWPKTTQNRKEWRQLSIMKPHSLEATRPRRSARRRLRRAR